jgi:hypothetical protein
LESPPPAGAGESFLLILPILHISKFLIFLFLIPYFLFWLLNIAAWCSFADFGKSASRGSRRILSPDPEHWERERNELNHTDPIYLYPTPWRCSVPLPEAVTIIQRRGVVMVNCGMSIAVHQTMPAEFSTPRRPLSYFLF